MRRQELSGSRWQARRRDLRRHGNLTPYRRALDWLLDRSIQYGYQTWRAIVAVALVYVIAVAVYWAAEHHSNLIVPVMAIKADARAAIPTDCTRYYPCFYPASIPLLSRWLRHRHGHPDHQRASS
jgi:hypothetical protein